MQIVTVTGIDYGFNADYICDECSAVINSNYYWFDDIVIIDNYIVDKIRCPHCFAIIKILYTNITKPYNKSFYILKEESSIICGIGCMEIGKDFIIS